MWKEEKSQYWCIGNLVVVGFAMKLEEWRKHFHGVSSSKTEKKSLVNKWTYQKNKHWQLCVDYL